MKPFGKFTSKLIPLPHNDVDTDQIIPAEYLKVTDKAGLVEGLFSRWRYLPDGTLNENFPLNNPEYQDGAVLLAGDNFGCGSSREHAPWALAGWGIKAVISTSFADIFKNNALKNGLLPIEVDEDTHQALFDLVEEIPGYQVEIDLEKQQLLLPGGQTAEFPIDPFSKLCLLEGVDQLGYLLKQDEMITAFEKTRDRWSSQ